MAESPVCSPRKMLHSDITTLSASVTLMLIRDAIPTDAESIKEIYNDAVLNTTAIWNDVTVDTANRVKWIQDRQAMGYPVLVAVNDVGQVIGYSSFGDWRAFDGFRRTVENSVYVHKDARGTGAGKALLATLIERARSIGKHVIVAGIEAGNETSIALHQKFGFVQTAHMPEVGMKFGRWLDLAFLQLKLNDDQAS